MSDDAVKGSDATAHSTNVSARSSKAAMTSMEQDMSTTLSWEDVAIVNRVDMEASFAAAIKMHLDNEVPALVSSSDSSCASDSTDISSCDGPLMASLSNMRLSNGPSVKFSTVTVLEHSLTIGNHPGVDMYPISLDWPVFHTDPQSVDDFEAKRKAPVACQQFKRSGIKASRLSATERMARLAEVTGWTKEELFQHERKRQLTAQEEKRRAALGLPMVYT